MTFDMINDTTFMAALSTTLLPFLAFAVIMIGTRKRPMLSAGISIGAICVSLLCAVYLLTRHWNMTQPIEIAGKWAVSGELVIPVGFLIDPLSLLMTMIVTTISCLVQIYSLGYMAGDPGFSRYYGFMSLFAWAMISLCLSSSVLQLYIFWELVGLASYLLIGFWYEKFSASEAGKKAFVMTRLGDVSFLLGLILLLTELGNLDILVLNGEQITQQLSPSVMALSAFLIFGGIVGKSAQFPLLTWLPDAMEGPTPVSALLHSATMVAAGVFLFARLFPFFSGSSAAMTVFLAIGTISMLLASTMAMTARDIKQVWAYSTVSQLGFMIMGLGAGGYFAGVFHLTTHAGFKALLFLCSGVFIHICGSNDMFDIARSGGRKLVAPLICMTLGAAALSGLPPLSGFFSKELILSSLALLDNPIWLWAGILGAFLTAYYTFRLIFVIIFPKPGTENNLQTDSDHHEHGHDVHHGYREMVWPLIILAGVTVLLGFGQTGLEHFLTGTGTAPVDHHDGGHAIWLLFTAMGAALSGLALAWYEFGRKGADQIGFVERIPWLANLFSERWYIDRFYRWFLDQVIYKGISQNCLKNDNQIIDGGVHALGRGAVKTGRILANLHLSMIQYRLMVMFAVIFLISVYFFFG